MKCPICQHPAANLAALNAHLDSQHFANDSQPISEGLEPRNRLGGRTDGQGGNNSTTLAENLRGLFARLATMSADDDRPVTPGGGTRNESAAVGAVGGNFLEDWLLSSSGDGSGVGMAVDTSHWQTTGDRCSQPGCLRSRLQQTSTLLRSAQSTAHNCRKCGRIFCLDHCCYRMRLNQRAQHDPEHGEWMQVCHGCFTSQSGYRDTLGKTRSWNGTFLALRRKHVDRSQLEANRLQIRWQKLQQLRQPGASMFAAGTMSSPSPVVTPQGMQSPRIALSRSASQGFAGNASSFSLVRRPRSQTAASDASTTATNTTTTAALVSGVKQGLFAFVNALPYNNPLAIREAEKRVVEWQQDAAVSACPFCLQPFQTLVWRKHHCRLCGKVICEDCSEMVVLFPRDGEDSPEEEHDAAMEKFRICSRCHLLTQKKTKFLQDVQTRQPIVSLYEKLVGIRQKIEEKLPRFNELLLAVSQSQTDDTATPPSASWAYPSAWEARKELVQWFTQFDAIARKVMTLPTTAENPTQKKVQTNIYQYANQYLQLNMFTLQLLPRPTGMGVGGGAKMLQDAEDSREEPSPPPDQDSPYVLVLKEQRQQLVKTIEEAAKQRKLDDVRALQSNLEEIDREIAFAIAAAQTGSQIE